jgi:hypothetical protein
VTIERLQQEISAKTELLNNLEKLSSISAKSLSRTEDLGRALDFSEGEGVFERTLKLFRDLKSCSLDSVPFEILAQLSAAAQQALQRFSQIQVFDPGNQPNPARQKDSLIQLVASEYEGHFRLISPVISYSIRKGTDFDQLEANARGIVAEMERAQERQKELFSKSQQDINDTLDKVRKAAAEVGVAQHSVHFKEQADEHLKKTRTWLIWTGILAVLTLLFGVYNAYYYISHIQDLTSSQSIQIGIAKLIIFSILYSAAFWSGRLYKAQLHNYVINKHRQNALSTFETFVKAASDDQTKNAVLLQATQSIFSLQNSGFVSQGEQPASPQILEVIRGVTGVGDRDN